MKSIEELLRNLARPDVLEFGLVTNRLPSINVGGRFEPVDDEAPSTDRVKQMLVAMGGGRFIETLSDKPIQWTTRLDGVGVIAVAAIMRKDVVQARFTVARREAAQQRPSQAQPVAQPQVPPKPPTFARAQQGTGAPAQPVAPPAPVLPREGSKTDEWEEEDDDNEPTVQTLSPQTPKNVPAEAPRPKPPRRPEEVRSSPPVAASSSDTVTTLTAASAAAPSPSEPPPDVDVEITTNDSSAMAAALDEDTEGTEHTVEVVPKKAEEDAEPESRPQPIPAAAKVAAKPEAKPEPKAEAKAEAKPEARAEAKAEPKLTGAMPSVAHSAIPSTTPSGISVAEKERPRIDGGAALDSFLAMAVAAHATDLHLVGGRPVLLRVASDLVARTQSVSAEHVERIVKEVLPPRLRETLDAEGACDFAIDHAQHGRFRVNLTKQLGGTALAIRILAREVPSVRALALPESVTNATHHTQGLVLVTGPAGHGKSTTLAALVDAINANADAPRHVYTIEDPIEHVHPKRRGMVTQREIGTHVKSWAQAIDDALAADVDVVVIGDLRDEAAVRAALTACEAGRLVLATMSCMSAARAVDRIVERFPPNEQPRTRTTLASAIRLVVGQRLVPSSDRTKLHLALEVLPGTSSLYTLVRDGRTNQISSLMQRARAEGSRFLRLDDSLAELVRAQKVTLDAAKQFAESPADLAAKKG